MDLHTRVECLRRHLAYEHKQSKVAEYFKEIIYGGVDGIITTFAVVAGFSGAALSSETTTQLSFVVVLLFGLANLFADGASMGLGNFLAVKSDQDLYKAARKKELTEIREHPEMETEESITILMQKGFSEEDAYKLVEIYKTNEDFWTTFMMNHELEMSDPTGDNPILTGLATFFSFLIFGMVPLIPFLLMGDTSAETAFTFSTFSTLTALILLGVLKWQVIGSKLYTAILEVVLVGGTAALVAYYVGSLFSV